jgi:hypothetical protein
MTITVTLSEALDKCNDWLAFCSEFGYDEYCVNEGGGDVTVALTEKQAVKHGLIQGRIHKELCAYNYTDGVEQCDCDDLD